MELTQDDAKVKGRYAARGNSTIEGKATGRRLDFRFHSFRDGQGWLDISSDGKSVSGAGNVDGFPGWFGWHGQANASFTRHTPLAPAKIVDGSTQSLLTYSIRAPEAFQAESSRKWPAVLILHGSNMNSRSYVNTIASVWPDIARDFILLGINGETPSSVDDEPRFNYSYVNYVGRSTFGGFPGTDRESPALVSEAMKELKEVYPISHYLVGGHSQGGFLTYSLLMNFPESMAGAFPISCGVIFQCEPEAYNDGSLRRRPAGSAAGDRSWHQRPCHGLRHGPVRRDPVRRVGLAGLSILHRRRRRTHVWSSAGRTGDPLAGGAVLDQSRGAARLCRVATGPRRLSRRRRRAQARARPEAR